MNIVSALYKIARTANNVRAIVEPKRLPRRIKNIAISRILGRLGFWRNLWK